MSLLLQSFHCVFCTDSVTMLYFLFAVLFTTFIFSGTEGPANAQVDGKFDVIVEGSLGAKLAGINIPPHLEAKDKTVYSKMFSLWRN